MDVGNYIKGNQYSLSTSLAISVALAGETDWYPYLKVSEITGLLHFSWRCTNIIEYFIYCKIFSNWPIITELTLTECKQ